MTLQSTVTVSTSVPRYSVLQFINMSQFSDLLQNIFKLQMPDVGIFLYHFSEIHQHLHILRDVVMQGSSVDRR